MKQPTESEVLAACAFLINLCDQEHLAELLLSDDETKVNKVFDRVGTELLKYDQSSLKKALAEVTAKLLRSTFVDAWQCECGSRECEDSTFYQDDVIYYSCRCCLSCGNKYSIEDDSLPTRLEGSE